MQTIKAQDQAIATTWTVCWRRPAESAWGQNRKSGDAIATSDLPLKADIKRTWRHVRKVPRGDMPTVPKEAIVSVCHFGIPALGGAERAVRHRRL